MTGAMRAQGRGRGHTGQGLVEFAVVLPVFLLGVFGLIDVGRLVYSNAALSQAAREGARVAAVEAGWVGLADPACVANASLITASNPGAHVCPASVAALKADVVTAANRMTVGLNPLTTADVFLSCNPISGTPPTGAWTETVGGNGCKDGSGNPIAGHGYQVSVRIQYTYQTITPFISSLMGSVPVSSAVTMIIN